jgi:hypothetical protein
MTRRALLGLLAVLLVLAGCTAPATRHSTGPAPAPPSSSADAASRVATTGAATPLALTPGADPDADADLTAAPLGGQPTVRRLAIVPYTDPPRITGSWDGLVCQASADGHRPDPLCTPGAVGTTDKQEVCAGNFSRQHRPPPYDSNKAKAAAMLAYGIPAAEIDTTEGDHQVPLGVGGSNDRLNYWPQRSDLPGKGVYNTKDKVEARVIRALCAAGSRLTLIAVQEAFNRDWHIVLAVLRIPER